MEMCLELVVKGADATVYVFDEARKPVPAASFRLGGAGYMPSAHTLGLMPGPPWQVAQCSEKWPAAPATFDCSSYPGGAARPAARTWIERTRAFSRSQELAG